jgi:hypothetical protein
MSEACIVIAWLRRIATQARRCCKQTPKTKKKKPTRKQNGIKGTFGSKKQKKNKKVLVLAHCLLYLIPYGYFQTLLD